MLFLPWLHYSSAVVTEWSSEVTWVLHHQRILSLFTDFSFQVCWWMMSSLNKLWFPLLTQQCQLDLSKSFQQLILLQDLPVSWVDHHSSSSTTHHFFRVFSKLGKTYSSINTLALVSSSNKEKQRKVKYSTWSIDFSKEVSVLWWMNTSLSRIIKEIK